MSQIIEVFLKTLSWIKIDSYRKRKEERLKEEERNREKKVLKYRQREKNKRRSVIIARKQDSEIANKFVLLTYRTTNKHIVSLLTSFATKIVFFISAVVYEYRNSTIGD